LRSEGGERMSLDGKKFQSSITNTLFSWAFETLM